MKRLLILLYLITISTFADSNVPEIIEVVNDNNIPRLRALVKIKSNLNQTDRYARTPLMIASMDNNLEAIKLLISAGSDVNQKHSENGKTALMYAASFGHYEIAKTLIDKKALIDSKDKEGKTALMHAIIKGRKEIVQLLIANKANVNARTIGEDSPLRYAMQSGKPEIVKMLKDANARE